MASFLMVKTRRRQSSPDASGDRLNHQGHNGGKSVPESVQFLSDDRSESIAEPTITNNSYFSEKDQTDNDISKALEIVRLQRRESMARQDHHQHTGDTEMMVPKTLKILKKLRSQSSGGLSSSAPAHYTLSDQELGKLNCKRSQSAGNAFMNHINFHAECGQSEMKPHPESLDKLKIQRRGSLTEALMFHTGHPDEGGQSEMKSLPNPLDKLKNRRKGSITEALLSHAGHLDVGGHSEMKPFPKALDRLRLERRGSITEAFQSYAGHLDLGGMKPFPKALELLKNQQRKGSIADALLACSINHDLSGPNDMNSLPMEREVPRNQRRQRSPGAFLLHTSYYSDGEQELKMPPKMVAMLRQPRRQSSSVTSDHVNYYGVAELDQPMRYSSKLMNSIWGHYNENSVHNFKSLQCGGVSFSCPAAAEQRHQHSHKLAGSPAPTRRGKLQQRLGELGEAVAANFMDNLNQYY